MKSLLFVFSWKRFPTSRRKMREFAEERWKSISLTDARKTLFWFVQMALWNVHCLSTDVLIIDRGNPAGRAALSLAEAEEICWLVPPNPESARSRGSCRKCKITFKGKFLHESMTPVRILFLCQSHFLWVNVYAKGLLLQLKWCITLTCFFKLVF